MSLFMNLFSAQVIAKFFSKDNYFFNRYNIYYSVIVLFYLIMQMKLKLYYKRS